MGADQRLLEAQLAALPGAVAAPWIAPEPEESLSDYARRMAHAVDPQQPCLIGGVSMGGMVAVEMARHLDARACLLISSIRSPRELPRRWRVFRGVVRRLPFFCFRLRRVVVAQFLKAAGPWLSGIWRSLLLQYVETDDAFLRWSVIAVLNWEQPDGPPPVPIVQIHGDRDFMLPHRLTRPDVLVPGAGHAMISTHAAIVTEFLGEQRRKFGIEPRTS